MTDKEKVEDYMNKLEHPLKKEMEELREIIKGANSKIKERIKWNATSYYNNEDLVTFNPRATKHVHLVFHHPQIINIKSDLLEGDYKDRRMSYFYEMEEVLAKRGELERIIDTLVELAEQ